MRHGKFLLIDVGGVTPNLICNTVADWPAADVWNYEKFDQDDVNKSLIKDGEDEDHMGNKGFHKQVTFAMGIIVKDDDAFTKLATVLPGAATFKKINIV